MSGATARAAAAERGRLRRGAGVGAAAAQGRWPTPRGRNRHTRSPWGTPRHALIGARLSGRLSRAAGEGPCQAYNADLRVCVNASRRFVYPDATIVCGELEHPPEDAHGVAVSNPRAVFEVLSPSTAA